MIRARSILCVVLALAVLAASAWPVPARAGTMSGAATEWTQITNMVSLIQQIVQQIKMVISLKKQIEYWVQSVKKLDNPQDAMRIYAGFQSAMANTQAILFAGQSLRDRWKQTHPGPVDPQKRGQTDEQAYRKLDEDLHTSVEKSLRVLDAVHAGASQDRQIFEALQRKMQSVNGQVEAAMMGNEILLEILRTLHRANDLAMADHQMQAEALSADLQRREYGDVKWGYTGASASKKPIDFRRRR